MILTDRDVNILKAVYEFGCLTTTQIASLFDIHLKVCQRLLRRLVKADYLRRISVPSINNPGRNPSLLYPGLATSELYGIPISKPRLTLSLTHQQKNTDLMIQIILTFKNQPLECLTMPEHLIKMSGQEIIPDGALLLRKKSNSALFFLENDSGTESILSPSFNQDIESKFIRYAEMFEQNKIQLYNDFFDSELNRFRVLFITSSPRRLTSIYKIASEQDHFGFIWLTTLNEFKKKGIDSSIWHVPARSESNQKFI